MKKKKYQINDPDDEYFQTLMDIFGLPDPLTLYDWLEKTDGRKTKSRMKQHIRPQPRILS